MGVHEMGGGRLGWWGESGARFRPEMPVGRGCRSLAGLGIWGAASTWMGLAGDTKGGSVVGVPALSPGH